MSKDTVITGDQRDDAMFRLKDRVWVHTLQAYLDRLEKGHITLKQLSVRTGYSEKRLTKMFSSPLFMDNAHAGLILEALGADFNITITFPELTEGLPV